MLRISFSLTEYVVCFITQKPQHLSKITASSFWSFKKSVAFLIPLSIGVSITFLAYHLADNSISHNFSPSVLFSLYSRTNLAKSARKCTSLNWSLTGCFGPNDETSRTNFGSSTPSSVTTLLWDPFRKGLSCLSDSFANLSLSILLINLEWSLISFLLLYTIEGNSSFFACFLRMAIFSPNFSSNNLRPCSARLISFVKSLIWKLCTAWSERISFLGIRNLKNPEWYHCYYSFSKNLIDIYSLTVYLKILHSLWIVLSSCCAWECI